MLIAEDAFGTLRAPFRHDAQVKRPEPHAGAGEEPDVLRVEVANAENSFSAPLPPHSGHSTPMSA